MIEWNGSSTLFLQKNAIAFRKKRQPKYSFITYNVTVLSHGNGYTAYAMNDKCVYLRNTRIYKDRKQEEGGDGHDV